MRTKLLVAVAVGVLILLTLAIMVPLLTIYGSSRDDDIKKDIQSGPEYESETEAKLKMKHNSKGKYAETTCQPCLSQESANSKLEPATDIIITKNNNNLELSEILAMEVTNRLAQEGKIQFKRIGSEKDLPKTPEISCLSKIVMEFVSQSGNAKTEVGKLFQPLRIGQHIVVRGKIFVKPMCISVSLDTNEYHSDAVVAYLNPRFDHKNDKKVFVRQSRTDGANYFASEDRTQISFPFEENTFFEMVISCTGAYSISIKVMGNITLSYTSQVMISKATHVRTSGNMTVIDVWQM